MALHGLSHCFLKEHFMTVASEIHVNTLKQPLDLRLVTNIKIFEKFQMLCYVATQTTLLSEQTQLHHEIPQNLQGLDKIMLSYINTQTNLFYIILQTNP